MMLAACMSLAALHARAQPAPERSGAHGGELLYIGTWGTEAPPPSGMESAKPVKANAPVGIYAARLDENTGDLTPLGLQMPLQRADSLLVNPKQPVLYSVAASPIDPHADTEVYAFRIDVDSGRLSVLDKVGSGGKDATALAFDDRSATLFVGNHGSGSVASLPIRNDGSLGSVVSLGRDYGHGPTSRQRAPQAHGVAVDPSGRYVVVADFGADRIFVYRFDRATRELSRAQPPYVSVMPGSAPRHIAFSPDGRLMFLDTELSAIVQSYRWDSRNGHLTPIQTVSPFAAPHGMSTPDRGGAWIALSADGRFVYFSVRDHENAIFVYAVEQARGTLRLIQRISAQGERPWSFGIDPSGRWMVVANMGSQAVSVLRIDRATGRVSPTGRSISVPNPAAIAFYAGRARP
jgi:6-phosphogluconolactonase